MEEFTKLPSNGDKKEKNNQGSTDIDCSKPEESLNKILDFNSGAWSSDTVFEERKRKEIIHDIKKIDGGYNNRTAEY